MVGLIVMKKPSTLNDNETKWTAAGTVDKPLVISVILNTNRRDDTLICLNSLAKSAYKNHQTIVLDNSSTDGSIEAIHESFPDVRIISLKDNKGYAGNNNVGIQAALDLGADWVFVLNEDTVLAEDCIQHLVKVAEIDTKIGIVGPLVYHYNEPEVIQSAGGWLNNHWEAGHFSHNKPDMGQYNQPHSVNWVSGCAILVRRAVIEQIGALDERFFYYWEETEWCLRASRAGWLIMLVPAAKLWHKGVQRNYQPNSNVTYYNTRNHLMMMQEHRAPLVAWSYTWLNLSKTFISWSLRPKWAYMAEHRAALWQGVYDFLRRRWGMRDLQ
jgi:GT2 family glycosyltransferase